jgi:hypothetical protein
MAYSVDNLSAISSSNSNTGKFFMYKEAATLAAIRASGYFDSATDAGLGDGDMILIIASDGFGFNDIVVTGTTYTVGEAVTSA